MRTRPLPLALVPFALALAACDGNGSGAGVLHEFVNAGKLCLFPASVTMGAPGFPTLDGPYTYAADEPVNVAVQFPACLSSSCSTKRMASCSVTATAGGLRVDSSGSFVDVSGPGGCTLDCGFLVARCATAPLPAGTTTFEHGTDRLALTVPASGPAPCVGAAP